MKIIFLALLLAPQFSLAGVLTFKVQGFKEFVGDIRLAIYNSKETHLNEKVTFRTEVARVTGEEVFVRAQNIPFGTYSVAAVHDADQNGVLTSNWMSLPEELFGFTNITKLPKGKPSFEECKISFNDNAQVFEIKLLEFSFSKIF